MKACIPFVVLLFSLNAVSSAFGQCDPLLEGMSPAFEFTIPEGVMVTSVVVKVNNYTNGGNHYSARIRSFQDLETVRVSKSGWYQVLLDPIVGPSVQDLQIESGIDDFCGYVGDSVRFDWQVVITAEGAEGTLINYSGPLTDNLAGADDLGKVFSGDNLVSGSVDLELTGNGVALYPDMDHDGFGDAFSDPVLACSEYCQYATSTNNLDCDDTDQSINPDQTEIPNNSIDEDCSGSDLVTEQLFVEVSVPFEQVSAGSSAWADYDNDGDMDVLITGLGTSGRMATLYQNNQGTFTEVPQTPFEPVFHSDVAWADYDSDGDLDVLIAGNDNNSATITKLYQNDGGNFTEVTFASLLGVSHCDVAWEDYDNDGDPDIMMIGFSDQENRTAKLYENQAGVFVEVSTPFHPNHNGAVAWADYNSDGRPDLFITDYSTSEASRLYENLPEGFAPVSGVPFLPLSFSSAAWADYDQDGDPDLLVAGYNTTQGTVTKLYENQQGTFAELPNTPFTGIDLGAVSWADYDSDGDPDVMISGNNDNNEVTALYKNDGGQFTKVLHTPFPNLSYSDLTWADYDGDGNQDVLITGMNALGRFTRLYENKHKLTVASPAVTKAVAIEPTKIGRFGRSVNISGDYAIVGTSANTAYLYKNDSLGGWKLVQQLVSPDTSSTAFGSWVDISDEYAIVGDPSTHSVFVFQRNTDQWNNIQRLSAAEKPVGYGSRVAIAGSNIIVGASNENMNGIDYVGSAYLYRLNASGQWGNEQKITATERKGGAFFGHSVDVSNDYAIVGAHREDVSFTKKEVGAAYLFERSDNGEWVLAQQLSAPIQVEGAYFGSSVSLSDDLAIVSADSEKKIEKKHGVTHGTGSAYVYKRNEHGNWQKQQQLQSSDPYTGEAFGVSATMDKNTIIVGAYNNEKVVSKEGISEKHQAGAAYVFKKDSTGKWAENRKLLAPEANYWQLFGSAVAVSGETLLVGASKENYRTEDQSLISNAGAAYFFNLNKLVSPPTLTVTSERTSESQVEITFQSNRKLYDLEASDIFIGAPNAKRSNILSELVTQDSIAFVAIIKAYSDKGGIIPIHIPAHGAHDVEGTAIEVQEFSVYYSEYSTNKLVIVPNQAFEAVENAEENTTVGTLMVTEADQVDSLTHWQIVSGNVDSAFVVEPHTGTIRLARASLDYETTKRYTLGLTVSNGSYTAKPEAVIINVTDVTEEGPVPVIAWHRVDSVSRSAKLVVDFGEVISGFEQRDVSTVNATTVELTTQDSITFMATVAAATSDSVTVWVPAAVAFDQMGNPTQASEALAITYSSSPVDSTATDSLFTLTVELIALGTKDQIPPVLLSLYQKKEGRFESVTVREMSGARLSLEGLAAGEYAFGVYAADTTFLPAYSGNRLMLSLASTVSLYQDTVQQLTLIARPVRRAGTATITGVLRESSEVENGRVAVYQAATDGEVVPHASLYLLDPQTREVVAYTVTDEAGRFSFHGLAAGQYLLAADHRGLPNDDAQNLIQATSNEAVSVTVVAGQTVRVTQVQAPEVITGLDILDQPEINYFPNPTINELIVQTSTDWIGGSLQLRDASGRLMMTQEVTQPLTRLNLVSLPTGVYAASLLKEGQRYTFKVGKQ